MNLPLRFVRLDVSVEPGLSTVVQYRAMPLTPLESSKAGPGLGLMGNEGIM